MPAAFITATGTDIGKTFVTAGLARGLREKGHRVAVRKPVVTGFDAKAWAGSDPAVLLEAIGETPSLAAIEKIAPYRFVPPLSPDMAARRDGTAIDFADLVAFCRKSLAEAEDVLLFEGIGGLMVPLTERHTVADLIAALKIPMILVTGSYVGSLSHTLTALEVAQHRGLPIAAVVVNESAGSAASPEETAGSLHAFFKAATLFIVRHDAPKVNADCFDALANLVASG
jgi:dethiobiotin synthetase